MKIVLDVPDTPHARHELASTSGKRIWIIIPTGLTNEEESDLAERLEGLARVMRSKPEIQ